MEISYKIIGAHIKQARLDNGLTQAEVAEKVDLSNIHYGHIERGNRPTSLDLLARFCLLFHRPLEYFIEGALIDIPVLSGENSSEHQIARINAMLRGCSEQMLNMVASVVEEITNYEKA